MPIVEPPSFETLGLVSFQINPHYLDPGSRHMGETRETRIREFHEENETPVVGLREGAMLRVEGTTVLLKGLAGARVLRRGREPVESCRSPPSRASCREPAGGGGAGHRRHHRGGRPQRRPGRLRLGPYRVEQLLGAVPEAQSLAELAPQLLQRGHGGRPLPPLALAPPPSVRASIAGGGSPTRPREAASHG